MKIGLVGWDMDERVIVGLARLGLECVCYTRWFPGCPFREDRDGWVLLRCPHQLGGGILEESSSFGQAVLRRAAEEGPGEYRVVHALDAPARAALDGFKASGAGCLGVASLGELDVLDEPDLRHVAAVDRWIGSDPWVAERWRAKNPGDATPIEIIESPPSRPAQPDERIAEAEIAGDDPLMLIWATSESRIDPIVVVEGLARARAAAPALRAVVLGSGVVAECLRRGLEQRGWLVGSASRVADPTLGRWRAWVARSQLVGVGARSLTDHPVARAAWWAGKLALPLEAADPEPLAAAILDGLYLAERRESEVCAAAAYASRRRQAAEVALDWLGVYLEGCGGRVVQGTGRFEPPGLPLEIGAKRTRLDLVAIDPGQVYASWSVRPADWSNALEWLGPDAARAVLAIRAADLAALPFQGDEGHPFRDIDLGLSEDHRTIRVDPSGGWLAARLGVRSPRGYFHTLAHARPCRLTSETLAPNGPTRRIRVLPRR